MQDEMRLLEGATAEERRSLAKLLDWSDNSPKGIAQGFWWNCQSIFGYLGLREPEYKRIVMQCLEALKIAVPSDADVAALEASLVQKVIATAWEQMTSEQRREFETKVQEAAALEGFDVAKLKALGPIGLLTVGQLSGFGIYLFASTALSTVVGAAGITLPFAAYTFMSSAIATLFGPVGWVGAGLFAIWKLTGPNYKKLVPAILYVSILRNKYPTIPPKRAAR
jgi:uncharacterized protein YaaW (UPF0174 family)